MSGVYKETFIDGEEVYGVVATDDFEEETYLGETLLGDSLLGEPIDESFVEGEEILNKFDVE